MGCGETHFACRKRLCDDALNAGQLRGLAGALIAAADELEGLLPNGLAS
jgi:hypothetical protein